MGSIFKTLIQQLIRMLSISPPCEEQYFGDEEHAYFHASGFHINYSKADATLTIRTRCESLKGFLKLNPAPASLPVYLEEGEVKIELGECGLFGHTEELATWITKLWLTDARHDYHGTFSSHGLVIDANHLLTAPYTRYRAMDNGTWQWSSGLMHPDNVACITRFLAHRDDVTAEFVDNNYTAEFKSVQAISEFGIFISSTFFELARFVGDEVLTNPDAYDMNALSIVRTIGGTKLGWKEPLKGSGLWENTAPDVGYRIANLYTSLELSPETESIIELLRPYIKTYRKSAICWESTVDVTGLIKDERITSAVVDTATKTFDNTISKFYEYSLWLPGEMIALGEIRKDHWLAEFINDPLNPIMVLSQTSGKVRQLTTNSDSANVDACKLAILCPLASTALKIKSRNPNMWLGRYQDNYLCYNAVAFEELYDK